ncbi:hypothetical protein [Streptomyces sp. NPDC056194]|uniref:hypothetical protein n=1 Tax=unclassified Streptomyces TaxID=2593676 RepID=UPI0035E1A621
MDLDAHVQRWSAPQVQVADGQVSQWMLASYLFAAQIRAESAELGDEQWSQVASAWAALLAAAERATGFQQAEWLLRDLWLRSWLLDRLGPQPGVELLERDPVLNRALEAMPMTPGRAATLGPVWRELEVGQILELRLIRRLLAPARSVRQMLVDHPRWAEFLAWEAVVPSLP